MLWTYPIPWTSCPIKQRDLRQIRTIYSTSYITQRHLLAPRQNERCTIFSLAHNNALPQNSSALLDLIVITILFFGGNYPPPRKAFLPWDNAGKSAERVRATVAGDGDCNWSHASLTTQQRCNNGWWSDKWWGWEVGRANLSRVWSSEKGMRTVESFL